MSRTKWSEKKPPYMYDLVRATSEIQRLDRAMCDLAEAMGHLTTMMSSLRQVVEMHGELFDDLREQDLLDLETGETIH